MKTKLTLKEKWFRFIGKKYRVNLWSKEIHRLDNKYINCLPSNKENTIYVSEKTAIHLINQREFNGCRWCWKKEDKG